MNGLERSFKGGDGTQVLLFFGFPSVLEGLEPVLIWNGYIEKDSGAFLIQDKVRAKAATVDITVLSVYSPAPAASLSETGNDGVVALSS